MINGLESELCAAAAGCKLGVLECVDRPIGEGWKRAVDYKPTCSDQFAPNQVCHPFHPLAHRRWTVHTADDKQTLGDWLATNNLDTRSK